MLLVVWGMVVSSENGRVDLWASTMVAMSLEITE